MAKKNRNILKGFFETGKKPTEGQYANLIDSFATLDSENTGSFDLKGNTILDGHLTASGGITASGTLVIGGEISASGGISSSGIIQAQRFIGDGTLISNITSSQVNIQGVTASFTSGAPTGSLIVSGNLFHPSASTNILMAIKTTGSIIPAYTSLYDLGSPTNHWNHLFVSNSFAKTYTGIFNGALSGSSLSSAAQGTAVLNTNGVAGSTIDLGLQTTDSVAFHSITASNDISASGDITASGLMIHGDISASGTVYANNFQSVGGDVAGISFTDDLNLTGDLTASGNISASGNILANNATIAEQLDITSINDSIINMYQSETLTTSFHSRGNINSFIEAGNSIANLGVGTSRPTEKLTVHGNISGSGDLIVNNINGTINGGTF